MTVEEQTVKDTVFIPDHPNTLKAEIARLVADNKAITEKLSAAIRESERDRSVAAQTAASRDVWAATAGRMGEDWKKLNELLNEYADERSMCDDYEGTLDEWNSEFTELKLTGRERDFKVSTTVTLSYEIIVPVRTSSASKAEDLVNDMSVEDLIDQHIPGIAHYDSSDFEVDEVEVAS